MSKLRLLGLFIAASLSAVQVIAADRFDFDRPGALSGVLETLERGPAGSEAESFAGAPAEWTVMVYINGKNNLEPFALMNVNQMEKVGSSGKVKVAVEMGRWGYSSEDGAWKGERRYIIGKDKDEKHVSSRVLQEFKDADMGDWHHLVDFVQWARKTAPAKHYMLIVWNHGSGWTVSRQNDGQIWAEGISYDDQTGNHITTEQLGQALAAVGQVDIYASDACLMQMMEVAFQIKDYAAVIVGSEEVEPGDGYTYDTLLAPLAAKPSMTAAELAKVTVKTYADHYKGGGQSATQSALDSSSLAKLSGLIDAWTDAVRSANETAVVKAAAEGAQAYYYADNKDLLDFVRKVDAATKSAAVKSAGAELERFLTGSVVLANAKVGDAVARSAGLAVYLPLGSYNSDYDALAWSQAGRWKPFLQWVLSLSSGS